LKKVKEVPKKLLEDGFNIRISTLGSSMFPLIMRGDKITISPETSFGIGNLIVFRRGEQMVCHRLVKVFEKKGIKYYQSRGDSFFRLDEPITSDQILGRVTKIERENVSVLRRILLFVHPVLRFSKVNAFVIAILIKLKAVLPSPKSH
jgi:hypothetical protein